MAFRPETFGCNGKTRLCIGVYIDERRTGEITEIGSLAIFKSGGTQRSFPTPTAAKRWVNDTYKAALQSAPPQRPGHQAGSPPPSTSSPPSIRVRTPFPDDPRTIEKAIFARMSAVGSLVVTPVDSGLPRVTVDQALRAGLDALLGPGERNEGGVLQAKRMIVADTIRAMGHPLPDAFDQPARKNPLVKERVVVVREKPEIPAVARAMIDALVHKAEGDREAQAEADPQPQPLDARSQFDQIADLFEDFEDGLDVVPEPVPESHNPISEPVPESRPQLPPKVPKFCEDEVRKIRAEYWHGSTGEELAEKYHTSVTTIDRIMDGSYVARRSTE